MGHVITCGIFTTRIYTTFWNWRTVFNFVSLWQTIPTKLFFFDKLWQNRLQFYSSDSEITSNELHETCLLSQFFVHTISKLKAINKNKSFYCLILILSGNISSNPGPVYNHHPWNLKIGIYLKYIFKKNIFKRNSPPSSKCHELRYIAKLSNAAVIGITESKLDNWILDLKIEIDNYQILLCDRNRKRGGVARYIGNALSYMGKDFLTKTVY